MIWNFCIRRPVFTIVVALVVMIFGVFSYRSLPVRENPDIDFPIVSVNVVLPGAEPEVIETEIIEPLEEEINTIEGIKTLTSTAREEVATVTAEFELWRDVDIAAQDVRDRLDRSMRELPEDIEAPIINKLDPDAQAIMWIGMTGSDRWSQVEITRYAEETLKERLENLRGVGRIQIGGSRQYAVRVILDSEKLAAHRLTIQDVVNTIRENNVDIPSGRIESRQREFLVKTRGQFSRPEPIGELIVAFGEDGPVRIKDVGDAVAGVENDRQLARLSRDESVGLGIVKQSDANTVALANRARERMEELSADFPPGLRYTIAADNSIYIEDNIRDLLITIFLAAVLVVLVVFLFLRTVGGTLISAVAIPISLLAGVALIYALGFTLNILTMLALILVIGIVVDDTIVVLENIYRKLEEGAEPIPAAQVGTTEVAFAAIANSLSLAAVFIPVAFTAGLIGRFFFEFGLTVALTVFASTVTALTLTPMLCSRLLRLPKKSGMLYRISESTLNALERAYAWILARAFAHRFVTVLIALFALGLSLFFFTRLGTEFTPAVDRGEFMIAFETPEGSTLDATDAYARQIERVLADTDGINTFFMAIGLSQGGGPGKVNNGLVFVNLFPRLERERHQKVIAQELRERLGQIPAGRAFVIEQAGVSAGQGQQPLQLVLQHPDLDTLAARQERIMAWMRAQPDYLGVNSNLKMNKPEVEIDIHRDKLSELGLSVADVSNTLRFLLGEPDISEIEQGNERYEVIPEVLQKGEMVPLDLREIYVRSDAGDLVSLGNIAEIEESIGPSEIHHFNRIRAATISGSTPPAVPLGAALDKLRAHLDAELPAGFDYTFTGQTQDFQESFYYLTIALIMAVVFIYLVLAAQFESFVHPFTILLTIPLASLGAFGALWATGMTLNIFSFIGLIMLLGMATKNAILLIDYTNVLRRRGHGVIEAAQEAGGVRFRPVIMTTVATVFGMLPIAFGFGAGGEARAPLGVAVAAGLTMTTLLTLVVIPVVYTLLDALQRRIGGLWRRDKATG